MPDWNKDVYSSMVSNIGYEEDGARLIVTWAKGGRRSAYSGVPEELAAQLANAPSVGSMLHTEVIPYFPHTYI